MLRLSLARHRPIFHFTRLVWKSLGDFPTPEVWQFVSEKGPYQKESSLLTIIIQPSFKGYLNFLGVYSVIKTCKYIDTSSWPWLLIPAFQPQKNPIGERDNSNCVLQWWHQRRGFSGGGAMESAPATPSMVLGASAFPSGAVSPMGGCCHFL